VALIGALAIMILPRHREVPAKKEEAFSEAT
jgi:hypothetical protein